MGVENQSQKLSFKIGVQNCIIPLLGNNIKDWKWGLNARIGNTNQGLVVSNYGILVYGITAQNWGIYFISV